MATIRTSDDNVLNIDTRLRIPNITGAHIIEPPDLDRTTDIFINDETNYLAIKGQTGPIINYYKPNPNEETGVNGGPSLNVFNVEIGDVLYLNGPTGMTGATINVPGDANENPTLVNGDTFSIQNKNEYSVDVTVSPTGSTQIESFYNRSNFTGAYTDLLTSKACVNYVYDEIANRWIAESSFGINAVGPALLSALFANNSSAFQTFTSTTAGTQNFVFSFSGSNTVVASTFNITYKKTSTKRIELRLREIGSTTAIATLALTLSTGPKIGKFVSTGLATVSQTESIYEVIAITTPDSGNSSYDAYSFRIF